MKEFNHIFTVGFEGYLKGKHADSECLKAYEDAVVAS